MLSRAIREQLDAGGCVEITDREGVFFPQHDVDRKSIGVLIEYINSYDTSMEDRSAQVLSPAHVGSDNLESMLRAYATAHHFKLAMTTRGDGLREAIVKKLGSEPATLQQLQQVHKFGSFDYGLMSSALHAFVEAKLSSNGAKDEAEVEAFIHRIGFGNKLEGIEYFVRAQTEKKGSGSKMAVV
ncbi:hypothetical protein M409DRAFT_22165 [Zasmidium cellare ATCC 36951]|uniref:Uncharacterized protein n=1 Tax=Zasmidium cellare ATCC 36951 TaxID=1080233 RepID=A0A6A6CJM2_ZASCE|nr:uncharacterized protein M409DRAFT_22165 [Zasmidium cellare ATCC 36951]KAF2167355.1 hypothetical protein M409DRAFT_22165 [Zasmidium cellare ATCC 36951]